MITKNKRLLDSDKNREYYRSSDGNFMPLHSAINAHKVLPRVAWVRDWVHKLRSDYHLDVGCKDGYTCLTLSAEGVNCVGLDPSEDAIQEARTKALEAGVEVAFLNTFFEDFLADGKNDMVFDTVSSMEVIEHVVDVDKFLAGLASMGQYVLITTPDANGRHGLLDSERNEEHVRVFTQDELIEVCSKFGTVVECKKEDDELFILFTTSKNG